MSWLSGLLNGETVVGTVLILSAVAAFGLALGAVKVRGVGLGIAGVLFAGLVFGHFGVTIQGHVLEFVREFGLILFVYTIGMQVGPGFLASLHRVGLRLNLLALCVVLLGVLTAVSIHFIADVPTPALVGILSGAVTNTPSLAAAQQALAEVTKADPAGHMAKLPGLGYAVAYPFGVVGIIGVLLLLRALFKVRLEVEQEALEAHAGVARARVLRSNFEVTNPNLVGRPLGKVPLVEHGEVTVSRIYREGTLDVARSERELRMGDVLLAVGTQKQLDAFGVVVGRESDLDLRALPSSITSRRLIVTHSSAGGKTIADLDFLGRFGVRITRVSRAEVEMATPEDFELQYGDTVLAVGEADSIQKVADELGDSPRSLNYPHLIPMFVGIALGVIVGSFPFTFPDAPAPVRLGLAGGPLLVAIALSRIGRIGPLVWYMPMSANYMLREVGIVLFLAAVGLRAGDRFVSTLVEGPGLQWMAYGALITVVPILIVGAYARAVLKLNYLTLCGVLAGSMTDPPALAFASAAARSDAPAISYATVYPLTMILRVVAAQLIVLLLR
jgi:putative transport protein